MNSFKQTLAEHKFLFSLLIATAVAIGTVVIAQAYYIVTAIDQVFLQDRSFQQILPLLLGLLAVFVARSVLTYASRWAGVKMATKVKGRLRTELLTNYSLRPLQASVKGQSGQKVSIMLDAVDEIDSYYSSYLPQLLQTTLVALTILIAVATQHIYTALIMLVTAPFIPIFMIIIGSMTKKKSEQQLDRLASFSGRFLNTLKGLTTLKLFGRAREQRELLRKSSLDFREATMGILKIAFLTSLMLEFISMLSIGLIALEVGLRLVVFDNITFFTAFFVLLLAPEFYLSLKDLGSAFHTGKVSKGAMAKVSEQLTQTEPAVEWGEERLSSEVPPRLTLQGVGFRYSDSRFALQGITAELPPYANVAIVGRSGSGKTTLLHLIAGLLQPSEGQIVINGRPRAAYQESEWFRHLSYISQNPYLFSGTIAENIAIGKRSSATEAEIEKAARQAGIAQMIDSLEHGFETLIGEGGRGLSGGEKQRLAIARAFLKRPSLILFDEPTTGLDLQTERILQASLKELSRTSTVITVAHRLHTIQSADRILFLADGELLATGTHAELLQSVTEYERMVSVQQGGEAK